MVVQMGAVLKNDYAKKMSLVALLKQYALDRNIDQFAGAVCVLLAQPQHQSLIQEIRYASHVRSSGSTITCCE